MNSIAHQIAEIGANACALTLYGSYAQMYDGTVKRFPQGVQIQEKRNNQGRCTKAVYQYADGSVLTFTWSDHNGSKFTAKKGN